MERGNYSKKGFVSYQFKKVSELVENRRFALAKKIILELLVDYPNDFRLKKLLSRIYIFERDYQSAKQVLETMNIQYSN